MAKPLNKSNKFYVEQHAGNKTVEEIAADLGLKVTTVQAAVDKLPKDTTTSVKSNPFNSWGDKQNREKHDIYSMTSSQSMKDDEAATSQPRNEEFFKERLPNNIHKIRPDEPSK